MAQGKPLKTLAVMRPYALIYLYRRRLRVHAVQELLAAAGIAIGVALVLATLVAERSISSSAQQVVSAVVGPATLQLRARDADGFSERLLARVEGLPGVKQAAPLLDRTAAVAGPHGRRVTVDLAGTDVSLAVLNGLAHTLPVSALSPGAIGLSRASAGVLGVSATNPQGNAVLLDLRGRATPLKVAAVLGPEAAGALARAQVAVMALGDMQRLAGLKGRITRILVQAKPGQQTAVRRELQTLAGGRLTVASSFEDVSLLRQALHPSDQASALFAAIGALLGFLLAFNAILLTVPERRRAIADLRLTGTRRVAIVQMVLFQALCLGIVASLAGVLGGFALSRWVLHQSTGYLAEAFTVSGATVVGAGPLLLASIGGVLVTVAASSVTLLDLRRGRTRDAVYREGGEPGNALDGTWHLWLFVAAMALLVLASGLFALASTTALIVSATLALATVLAVPLVFAGLLRAGAALAARREQLASLPIALASLRATTLRSLALAATGAVALFGSVALGGARANLLQGIRAFARSYVADAGIWVTNPGDNQAVEDFVPARYARRLASVPGVGNVRVFQGGFLTLHDRRVWVIARPPGADREVLSTQVVAGDSGSAVRRIGEGGWIAPSRQIADEQHVGVGGTMVLPTPSGAERFRIAATTTNLAWPPGVVFMNTRDFGRAWNTSAPTALGVSVSAGASAAAVRQAIERTAGPASGLEVSLAREREDRIDALASEGLGHLGEISTLLVIAAIAAMAAALASSLHQRRASLAGLRLSGAKPSRLRRVLLIEAGLMLGAGCLTGALVGIYGQVVIDGYLKHVTGFPLASVGTSGRPLEIFAIVLAGAMAIGLIPGWYASRVRPLLALGEE